MADLLKNLGLLVLVQIVNMLWAYPTMLCWNYVMPAMFKFPEITYWQTFCLMFVCSMTIKGYRYVDKV